jgi:glycosyltransferase involved in cell wall biosynthesis
MKNTVNSYRRDGFIILTVGRLHPVKDHCFLIKACGQLKQRGIPFLCIIIGEGVSRKRLQRLIEEMGLLREVKLLGSMDHLFLAAWYQIADLFVLTSKSEGLPLTIMEAMLNETIILAPRITGIPEIVIDERNGFLFESGNINDFVSKIRYIFEHHQSLCVIGKNARRHILQHFNRTRNMEVFAEMIIQRLESEKLS